MYAPNDKWVVFCSDDANPQYIHANNGGAVILGGRADAKLRRHCRTVPLTRLHRFIEDIKRRTDIVDAFPRTAA